MYADQSKSPINSTSPLVQEDVSGVLTTKGSYHSGRKLQAEHADVPLPKRTRSPTSQPTNGNFPHNPASVLDNHKRYQGNSNLQHFCSLNFYQKLVIGLIIKNLLCLGVGDVRKNFFPQFFFGWFLVFAFVSGTSHQSTIKCWATPKK